MLKAVAIRIDEIYVPTARRKDVDQAKVDAFAEDILNDREIPPIQVRKGDGRYVLVKGVNRMEARKALGEETVQAFIVQARLH